MASKLTRHLQLTLALIKPDVMANPLIVEVVINEVSLLILAYHEDRGPRDTIVPGQLSCSEVESTYNRQTKILLGRVFVI